MSLAGQGEAVDEGADLLGLQGRLEAVPFGEEGGPGKVQPEGPGKDLREEEDHGVGVLQAGFHPVARFLHGFAHLRHLAG